MTAKIRELKTPKTQAAEGMVEYLQEMIQQAQSGSIDNLVCIYDTGGVIRSNMIGDVSFTEAVGMIDTAKLAFQLEQFAGNSDDDE